MAVDDTYYIAQITLLEAITGAVEGKEGQAVEFQNFDEKDFRGKRSLGSGPLSRILTTHHPDDPHCTRLSGWWNTPEAENEFQELITPQSSSAEL